MGPVPLWMTFGVSEKEPRRTAPSYSLAAAKNFSWVLHSAADVFSDDPEFSGISATVGSWMRLGWNRLASTTTSATPLTTVCQFFGGGPTAAADSVGVTEPPVATMTSSIHGATICVWNGCFGGR